jgi:hypothetical protein
MILVQDDIDNESATIDHLEDDEFDEGLGFEEFEVRTTDFKESVSF